MDRAPAAGQAPAEGVVKPMTLELPNTMTNPTIYTDARIEQLRNEAAEAGDLAQVDLCDQALSGDVDARRACERVLAHAAAQFDIPSTPSGA